MDFVNITKKVAVVECIYGRQFTLLHTAPKYFDSFLFSNNKNIEMESKRKGWTFIYDKIDISNDEIISSIQSKKIKFLQFIDQYNFFNRYDYILYCDHKIKILFEHILRLLDISTKQITVRKHNHFRESV